MKEFFKNWIFNCRKKGKWSDLTREEQKRAKAFMYSAVAGSAIVPNSDGEIEIKVLQEDEDGSD